MDEIECARIYGRRAGELSEENARLKEMISRLEAEIEALMLRGDEDELMIDSLRAERDRWKTDYYSVVAINQKLSL